MNVPKLRFKEFNDELNEFQISKIMEIKNGLNKEKEEFGFGTPIINYMDVNKKELIFSKNIKGLVNANHKELASFKVKKGDIFFTRTSENSEEIGLSSSVMEDIKDCVFSGFILKATPKENILNPIFSGYYFRNPRMRNEIIKHSSITTRALTSGTLLGQMKVFIPSFIEQEKIGKTLYLLDKKIELQTKKIENLKLFKKGLINNEKNNSSNWKEFKIKNIFNITRGTVIPKKELSSIKTVEYQYPVYSSQTTNDGILGYDKKYDFDGKYLSWTTDGANAGKVFFRNGKFRCTNVCGLLYENQKNKFTNQLVAYLLNYETPKHVSYVGNPKLMNNVMGEIKIKLPTIEYQQYFSEIITLINKKIDKEIIKLNNLNKLKKGLMQKIFA